MKKAIRNILLVALTAMVLLGLAACMEQDAVGANPLQVETLRVLPKAYQFEEYDLRDIIIMEDGVSYSATACYVEQVLDEATKTYTMQTHLVEVVDLCFTPETLNDTEVIVTAARGKETASKKVSISTIVRADPLDDLYKASGLLGFADTGITKSVNTNKLYIQGENSATSLQVKFSGKEAHDWGNIFMELSHPSAQAHFTDQIWDNAIVTFWVYNPMEQDVEFQLTVNDHTFPVMLDWTGEEGNFRRQFAKAGEWTQIFFSLRRMGTTHKLVTDMYSTESVCIKFQYAGYSTTQEYEMEFYLDNLDVVPASMYPDVDTTYTQTNETLEQGWENMPQDTGWQGASTIYVYDEMYGDESTCSLYATFDSSEGVSSPFVVLNPEMMLGSAQMSGLPDMTGGTLTAYFKFESAAKEVRVDLIKQVGKEWKFSNMLPMTLTAAGNGWYKGTIDVNEFDFGSGRNDGITRIRFTFSGISKASKVWIDTVKFDYKNADKVRETIAQDWINLPLDSGMNVAHSIKFATNKLKAEGSARSLQVVANANQTGIVTVAPEFAVLEGNLSALPNMTKGTVHAYFYFGEQKPEASMRLYNTAWKYCPEVYFTFENMGDGWYYGSIPASLFKGYQEGDSSKIIRISILIPAGYTVYIDGLKYNSNEVYITELDPEDVFASGVFTANDFIGNAGCEVTQTVTNGSADAIYMWAENKTAWPTAGVSFASPIDISGYTELLLDVKAKNAHKWLSIKLGYADENGMEKFSEVGMDFMSDDWQTLTVKLSQFAGCDLTKVTKILVCVNMEDSFHVGERNEFWLDNMKLSTKEEDIGNRGQFFKGGENLFVEIAPADYASISFEYKLVTDGTMTLILRDPTWLRYFGDYIFTAEGTFGDYAGITTEKLDDGYIRVTMVMDELNRSGLADNRDNAPETLQIFDIYTLTTADGYVDKIQGIADEAEDPEQPEQPEQPADRGQLFKGGENLFVEIPNADYESISFEYKLITDGTMTLILRDPTWLRYFGDYIFTAEGTFGDYAGITTEKLDDGYIRVTMVMDELSRSGLADNRDNAPQTINIFDIYSFTTADGYVDQIQGTERAKADFDPEDMFASGQIVADGFVGDSGYEVTREDAHNSQDALHVWTNTKIGWPMIGVSFDAPVDISAYTNISLDVKVKNTHKWCSIKIGYLNGAGTELFSEVGADFAQEDWQTVTMKLSQFSGADLTKVTKILICMNLETNVSAGVCNEVWLDNLKVTADQSDNLEPGGLELSFLAHTNAFLTFEEHAFKAVQFDYQLESAGEMYIILRDGTWLKYFGDYAFNSDGETVDYAGITTEKLSNGYIRVTMILADLERSGCNNNRDIAPETLAVFDVFGTTTVAGHIKNLQFLNEVPTTFVKKPAQNILCWKPELKLLPEQEENAE